MKKLKTIFALLILGTAQVNITQAGEDSESFFEDVVALCCRTSVPSGNEYISVSSTTYEKAKQLCADAGGVVALNRNKDCIKITP